VPVPLRVAVALASQLPRFLCEEHDYQTVWPLSIRLIPTFHGVTSRYDLVAEDADDYLGVWFDSFEVLDKRSLHDGNLSRPIW
jgi:hypothetical protein